MKAQLFCRALPGLTLSFDLEAKDSVIGRDPRIAVSLPTDGVSRRHARVRKDGKSHWIEDLTSTNGTFLNGSPVSRERLRHLDVVSLGKAVDLIFVLRDEDFTPVERDGIRAARLIPTSGDAPPYEISIGEMTVGRSEACNLTVDSGSVSKQHARLKRSAEQLALQDLGSSNGTFVNGVRCESTLLRHGDEISLGGVDGFRVEIEVGRITSRSVAIDLDALKKAADTAERPQLNAQWKTRYEWSADEQAQIAAFQKQVAEEEKARKPGRTDESTNKVKAVKRVPTGRQPRPGALTTRPAVAPPRGKAPPPTRPPLARPVAPGGATVRPRVAERPPRPSAPQPPPAVRRVPRPEPSARPRPTPTRQPAAAPPTRPPQAPPPTQPPAARPAQPPVPAQRPPVAAPPSAPPIRRPARPQTTPPIARPPERPAVRPAQPHPEHRVPATPRHRTGPPSQPSASAAPPIDTEATVVGTAPTGRIGEVRLVGEGFDIGVSGAGQHQVGRAKEAALRIRHPTVSRRHAIVIISDDDMVAYLRHDAGTNGTFLNGGRIDSVQPLQDGDQVKVGEVRLAVQIKKV